VREITLGVGVLLWILGCGGDEDDNDDDVPEPPMDAAVMDAAPAPDADTRPQCMLPEVGPGPCCDLRNPDGSSARGICRDGSCMNSRWSQVSEYCAE
jgi:hypothetical protein